MTIKSNLAQSTIDIGISDTVIFNVGSSYSRESISAASIHNTTSSEITISVYESPDNTAASGVRVDRITLDANDRLDIESIIGQAYTSNKVIAVATAVGSNVSITSIGYSGDS